MDWKKPIGAIEPPVVEPPTSRSSARRYVSYRSLLLTGRAVWKQRSHVWYSSAGDNPQVLRLSCASGQEAKRVAGALASELRRACSDAEYNQTIVRFLAEIRQAWPDNTKIRHVHECDRGNVGEACGPNAEGTTPCGFRWQDHKLDDDRSCPCEPRRDTSDASGEWEFVVHTHYERKEMVSV